MRRATPLRGLWLVCALVIVACGGHAGGSASTGAPSRAPEAAGAAAPSGSAAAAAQSGSAAAISAASVPPGNWLTFDYDAQRSGVGPAKTGITARTVGRLLLRRVQITGIADSSAIELHAIKVRGRRRDLVAVTTTYGNTIALDAQTGAKLWEFSPAGVNRTPGNPQVTTASPVAGLDRRYLYAASPNGVIYKLSVHSGRQVWARRITFDPGHEKIASALNLSGRFVVAASGGYIGDIPPYDGHVVTIDRRTGRIDHVWNAACSNRHQLILAASCAVTHTRGDNAIWSRAGAVIEPGSRKILIATGNGPFDGSVNWGNSVLELSADAGQLLHNWTPQNQLALSHSDSDVGSTSPVLFPAYHGFHLAVQTGKDGKLHLLDLDRLDGTTGSPGSRLGGELEALSAPGGDQVFAAPAVWSSRGRSFVFVSNGSGSGAYELVGGGRPRLRVAWQNATPGTSPVVSGGLLYIYDEINGQLDIRQPTSGALLRALPAEHGHWNSPIVVGGRIILPTGSYFSSQSTSTIDIYHLPGR